MTDVNTIFVVLRLTYHLLRKQTLVISLDTIYRLRIKEIKFYNLPFFKASPMSGNLF